MVKVRLCLQAKSKSWPAGCSRHFGRQVKRHQSWYQFQPNRLWPRTWDAASWGISSWYWGPAKCLVVDQSKFTGSTDRNFV